MIDHSKYIDTIRFLKDGWDFENYSYKGISGKIEKNPCKCHKDHYCHNSEIVVSEMKFVLSEMLDSLFGYPFKIIPDPIIDTIFRKANLSINDFEVFIATGYYGKEFYIKLKEVKYNWILNHLISTQYLSDQDKQEYLNSIENL